MLQTIIPSIDYPSAFANWLNVFLNYSHKNKELAICGLEAKQFLSKINEHYLPNIVLAGTNNKSELPFLKDRFMENQTLFYVCQNKTCDLPEVNFEAVLGKLV